MDTRTLLATNVLLFGLYACMAVVSRRALRGLLSGSRGCRWFAGSNISLGAAAALLLFSGSPALHGSAEPLSWIAIASGRAMLHRSFAELVSRGKAMWATQCTIAALVLGCAVGAAWMPAMLPEMRLAATSSWVVQCLITAALLVGACRPGIRLAGWFTASVLIAYAISHVAWFGVVQALHMRSDVVLIKGMLLTGLVCHGATAFGFVLLMMSRVRMALEREAAQDELTGLLNRRALRKAAVHEIALSRRRSRPLAVVMIDLDDFKVINDRLGHAAGDTVLCAVARALEGVVRDGDKVARIGGDEFCLLLPQTPPAEALRVAAHCRAALASLVVPCAGSQVHIVGSVGVGYGVDGTLSWKRMLQKGDEALYEAKRAGKNRVAMRGDRPPRTRLRLLEEQSSVIERRTLRKRPV